MNYVYQGYFGALRMSGGYFQFQAPQIKVLPVCKISFSTSEKVIKESVQRVVDFYCSNKIEDILDWINSELLSNRNDTVHGFLAFLAQQMIEMKERKNNEIKGFLKWLENEIGTEIDLLTNKTVIKKYYDLEFRDVLDILKANKSKIAFDPSNRNKQEMLEENFNKSLAIISPLKKKILETDKLIDQVVYKLYSLTEEEIKIVEGK